jgi:uncharacterized membrane protein
MMELVAKYVSVVFASSLKFFGGPISAFLLQLSWVESVLLSATGMMVGVITTTLIGKQIQAMIENKRKKPKKRFSKSSRLAVNVWQRFGVIGIAAFTPVLFTPIGGALLVVAFRIPRRLAFFWMLVSALVWGVIVSYVIYKLSFIQDLIQ